MNKIGFGTYRVSIHNSKHTQALKWAIERGVRLIDSSTNYTNGDSQRLIGQVLNSPDMPVAREDITVISKFGYIQGSQLERYKSDDSLKDRVVCSPQCHHSIHPEFMREQLELSLGYMELEYIDTYLIHNPEYFIVEALKSGMSIEDAREQMHERVGRVFEALEYEVKKGRILDYGISSNSFSLREDDEIFLPYKPILELAKNAAASAKNEEHHFNTVELPINLLEREGLKCAKWAHENGIKVIANRPLNAISNGLMYRLANYKEPVEYFPTLNDTLEFFDTNLYKSIYNHIEELDSRRHRFGWIGDYEQFLFSNIIPFLRDALHGAQAESEAIEKIEKFLLIYRDMVAYETSIVTKASLHKLGLVVETRIQDNALKYLLEKAVVDYVLVGMRSVAYVEDVARISEESEL